MEEKLQLLLEYVKADGRVCLMPICWDELWKMLPDRRRVGSSWNPPPPLILGAWNYSANWEKALRLSEHILYASEHGVLDEVDRYLRSLRPEQWLYEDPK
jgi:hypothetical protein